MSGDIIKAGDNIIGDGHGIAWAVDGIGQSRGPAASPEEACARDQDIKRSKCQVNCTLDIALL